MAKQNESQLNALNQRLRGDPQYQQFLQSIGVQTNVAPNTPWRLSGGQREQAKQWVRQHYPGSISGNLQIDPSGNINQDEGFSKYAKDWKTYAAIGGGLTGVGALGYGPMAGLFGGGAAGAGGGAGAASSLIPNSGGALTAGLSGAAPAVASQGVSAGMGLGAGALGSGVTLGESAGTGLAGTAAGAGGASVFAVRARA